jgi:hypothetical protein
LGGKITDIPEWAKADNTEIYIANTFPSMLLQNVRTNQLVLVQQLIEYCEKLRTKLNGILARLENPKKCRIR